MSVRKGFGSKDRAMGLRAKGLGLTEGSHRLHCVIWGRLGFRDAKGCVRIYGDL